MSYPSNMKFTRNDEWVRVENGTATTGITDYAQEALSDIVYVELPSVGDSFRQGQAYASVESVKAAAEVYLPIGGTVTEVNETLNSTPETINAEPHDGGWIARFSVADPAELNALMDAEAYEKYCDERKA